MSDELWFVRVIHDDGSVVNSERDHLAPDERKKLEGLLADVLGGERGYLHLDLEGGGFAVVPLRRIRRVEVLPATKSGATAD